ncbi:MAG: signal peptidase II [Gemmatimonadota bacterium]
MQGSRQKLFTFLAIVPLWIALDWVTKRWALDALAGGRQIHVIPGFLPFTLAYNRGAAFGLEIGSDPRWVFVPITILALVLLSTLYVRAKPGDWLRVVSLALVIAGALGNLYDRLRWDRGVVDFIGPANLGFADFPIFNVADMGISCGAVLLAISFWLEERQLQAASQRVDVAAMPAVEER